MKARAQSRAGSSPPSRGFLGRHAGALLAAMIAAYVVVFSGIGVVKYRFYLFRDFDLAIFAQAVDRMLHGSMFSSIRGMPWLGDHASLVMFLIAPVYAIARHPITLLEIQTVGLALGALAVHRLAREELADEPLALAFAAAWLMYPALGYSNLFEFHPEALATPALVFAFLHVRRARVLPALAFAAFALLCREDVAFVVFLLGLYALAIHRRAALPLVLGMAGLAVASAIASFGLLFPAFDHGQAEHARRYASWGPTPRAALGAMLRDPMRVLSAPFASPGDPFDAVLKRESWIHLLLPLGLLPIAGLEVMLIALPVLLEHALSTRRQEHTIVYQYAALVTPFVFAAAIIGARRLLARTAGSAPGTPRVGPARRLAIALVTLGVGTNLMFGPLIGAGVTQSMLRPEANLPTPADRALLAHRDRMVATLPASGVVVAGFEFLPRLTNRDAVHSAHHLVSGLYTMSSRDYPPPANVTAMLADFGAPELVRSRNAGTAARIESLLRSEPLMPVDVADGLVLFLREPSNPLSLWSTGTSTSPETPRIVFDRAMALVSTTTDADSVAAGGLLPIRAIWQRVGPVDRSFVVSLGLYDDRGRGVRAGMRELGYGVSALGSWPEGADIEEYGALVVPPEIAPGVYRLAMRMSWRRGQETGACESDSPTLQSQGGLMPIARVRVTRAPKS